MQTRVTRLIANAPNDMAGLRQAFSEGRVDPRRVVAVLGKTEGNGCVNDFTRSFATSALQQLFAQALGISEAEVGSRIALVMSGGTEGGLCPHWLVFEVDRQTGGAWATPGLAAGVAFSRDMQPEELGRQAQIQLTSEAVRSAMQQAGIVRAEDVHYVQVKCPLLTASRIQDAAGRGHTVVCDDSYESMGFSRGASALGVALALGEVAPGIEDAAVCRDWSLYSQRASTSAGIELLRQEVLVLGNASGWDPAYRIGHAVMSDALDADAVDRALTSLPGQDIFDISAVQALLAKAEPGHSGLIRSFRHVMSDDSDINGSRHARALVGGVLAGRLGDTRLFVSGGAEHQGPDGGGPLAVVVRCDEGAMA